MKIDKAIEILELDKTCDFNGYAEEIEDALQLGIEALKRLAFNRLNTIASSDESLPGETKD